MGAANSMESKLINKILEGGGGGGGGDDDSQHRTRTRLGPYEGRGWEREFGSKSMMNDGVPSGCDM